MSRLTRRYVDADQQDADCQGHPITSSDLVPAPDLEFR
jgi:hypothetical protein